MHAYKHASGRLLALLHTGTLAYTQTNARTCTQNQTTGARVAGETQGAAGRDERKGPEIERDAWLLMCCRLSCLQARVRGVMGDMQPAACSLL